VENPVDNVGNFTDVMRVFSSGILHFYINKQNGSDLFVDTAVLCFIWLYDFSPKFSTECGKPGGYCGKQNNGFTQANADHHMNPKQKNQEKIP